MIAARAGAGRVLGLAAAALLLVGCGAGSGPRPAPRPTATGLCVEAVLPLGRRAPRTPAAQRAAAVLAGIRRGLPAAGVLIDGHRVRLCRVIDTTRPSGPAGVVSATVRALANPRTVAVIGGLDDADAELMGTLLQPADVGLVSPSPAPVTSPDELGRQRPPVVHLQPPLGATAPARGAAAGLRECGLDGRAGRRDCTVLAAGSLCSALGPASGPERLCVLPGDLAAGFGSPAMAYGAAAVGLVLDALGRVSRAGDDVSDRRVVLDALFGTATGGGPLGPIRLSSAGAAAPTVATLLAVSASGRTSRVGLLRLG